MSIARRNLYEGSAFGIGAFEANPASDRCGETEWQNLNALVLPFVGVFSKHETPSRQVIGTPSHAVFIGARVPYRISFPGAIGDRAIIFRFDETLLPEHTHRRGLCGQLKSHALLPAGAMVRRNVLWHRCNGGDADRFEIETLGFELLGQCLDALGGGSPTSETASSARLMRAVERVKEAVAVSPADPWRVAELAKIANLSAFHTCHVFRTMTGTSIYEYVLRERLGHALHRVLDGDEDITTIALDVGFSSHSHLTARFRRFFGCTPSGMRGSTGAIGNFRKIVTARGASQA